MDRWKIFREYLFFYTFIKVAQKFDFLDNKNVRNAMLRLKNSRIDGLHSELFLKISFPKWQVSGIQKDVRISVAKQFSTLQVNVVICWVYSFGASCE